MQSGSPKQAAGTSKATAAKTPKSTSKPSKIIHQVTSAFDKSQWPALEPNDSDIIISLLQTFLEPMGVYKSVYITPSKGKRDRKRKRKADESEAIPEDSTKSKEQEIPPPPVITRFITAGYNSTLRSLESTSEALPSAIFVTGNPEWPPYAQLPIICGLKAQQSRQQIRLILLEKKAEGILCAALGIPRVGVLGIRSDAPGIESLMKIVTENVQPIEAPWQAELDHLAKGKWLGADIDIVKPLIHVSER